jgi:hypothetical protein
MPSSKIYEVLNIVEGQPCFAVPLPEIISNLKKGDALKHISKNDYISEQQIKWWKGIFLPSLSNDNGEPVHVWENRLKLEIMPDEFEPVPVKVDGAEYVYIPSITKLSKKKMGVLMEGSVHHLRDNPKYGDRYQWVTLPNPDLRNEKNGPSM